MLGKDFPMWLWLLLCTWNRKKDFIIPSLGIFLTVLSPNASKTEPERSKGNTSRKNPGVTMWEIFERDLARRIWSSALVLKKNFFCKWSSFINKKDLHVHGRSQMLGIRQWMANITRKAFTLPITPSLPDPRLLWNWLADTISKFWHIWGKTDSHSTLTGFRVPDPALTESLCLTQTNYPPTRHTVWWRHSQRKRQSEDVLYVKSIHYGNSLHIWYHVLKWQKSTCIHHARVCILAFNFI